MGHSAATRLSHFNDSLALKIQSIKIEWPNCEHAKSLSQGHHLLKAIYRINTLYQHGKKALNPF